MPAVEAKVFHIDALREFSTRIFLHFHVPKEDAVQAADVLASADLRGIDSHGVARLYSYVGMLSEGHINPKPKIITVRSTLSTATIDGDNGLGLVVGPHSNRIAMAFPGKEEPHIVIDMATCGAAYGKIEMARRKGEAIPVGWGIDNQGRNTTNPDDPVNGGCLLPLGSDRERGGHKGYGLAVMVDVLCGVLSGANWGPFAPPFALRQEIPARSVGKGIGHFFGAMRIDGFIDADAFKRQIDDYVRVFRATKPAPGTSGPLIPGDPEREAERERRKNGVPLIMPIVEDLRTISRQTGIPFD